jgi:hypothetical protein
MPNLNVETVIIVGAGFSQYAGLPLTENFTKSLLEARKYPTGLSRVLVEFLSRFIHDSFGHSSKAGAKYWPSLEDIFTCVDLSSNSGHHLGPRFAPADLRTVRRALLARTIGMLYQANKDPRKRKSGDWRQLKRLFDRIDPKRIGFISMNWDNVIEKNLTGTYTEQLFDYCCDAQHALFPEDGSTIRPVDPLVKRRDVDEAVPIIKIHGSANWLYCDNCRELFWFHPDESWRIAAQIIGQADLNRISRFLTKKKQTALMASIKTESRIWCCSCSDQVPLGTRIATFSYQKALDFPMFQKSWFSAERLLQNARRWVFIGYSLPPADYEFKYLLKRVQLARLRSPEFIVVSGGSKRGVKATYDNYQRFFGNTIKRTGPSASFFERGLTDDVISRISR